MHQRHEESQPSELEMELRRKIAELEAREALLLAKLKLTEPAHRREQDERDRMAVAMLQLAVVRRKPGLGKIAKAVQTCQAAPSQWDAWTEGGRYLYLRYRHGIGTVDTYLDKNPSTWEYRPEGAIARFGTEDFGNSFITLDDFCARAELVIADDAELPEE